MPGACWECEETWCWSVGGGGGVECGTGTGVDAGEWNDPLGEAGECVGVA